ncbi:hypothetical protein Bbelb_400580 [Branchiostoma belcheri]|nr:hypothetical protein Bbelb_400580 [Branchiostoma belcheri]
MSLKSTTIRGMSGSQAQTFVTYQRVKFNFSCCPTVQTATRLLGNNNTDPEQDLHLTTGDQNNRTTQEQNNVVQYGPCSGLLGNSTVTYHDPENRTSATRTLQMATSLSTGTINMTTELLHALREQYWTLPELYRRAGLKLTAVQKATHPQKQDLLLNVTSPVGKLWFGPLYPRELLSAATKCGRQQGPKRAYSPLQNDPLLETGGNRPFCTQKLSDDTTPPCGQAQWNSPALLAFGTHCVQNSPVGCHKCHSTLSWGLHGGVPATIYTTTLQNCAEQPSGMPQVSLYTLMGPAWGGPSNNLHYNSTEQPSGMPQVSLYTLMEPA